MITILHLVGSQTSEYYYNIALLYASGCIKILSGLANQVILLLRLDGTWSVLQDNLDHMDQAERLTLFQALQMLSIEAPPSNKKIEHDEKDENEPDNKKNNSLTTTMTTTNSPTIANSPTIEKSQPHIPCPDIVQPHMFCYNGMTLMRSIAHFLDLPLLGSPGHVMALTTDKWQSRAVVASVGVPVPRAQLLHSPHDPIDDFLEPPFVLKPCREDNSVGITLVQDWSQLPQALETAFAFDDQILCEQFVPLGRELRVGVVERQDSKELELLPIMEYFLGHKKLPIRTSADKLSSTGHALAPVERQTPASDIDETLRSKLYRLACQAHQSLGCQYYSLYDVRVDPQGNPFFIEASPYCSFSPSSALVTMSRGDDDVVHRDLYYNNTDLFFRLAQKAIQDYVPCSRHSDRTCGSSGSVDNQTVVEEVCKFQVQRLGMRHKALLNTSSIKANTFKEQDFPEPQLAPANAAAIFSVTATSQ
ncbi:hypothetical protein ACA910_014223 [Epithemia clementina (nom. ined.)]